MDLVRKFFRLLIISVVNFGTFPELVIRDNNDSPAIKKFDVMHARTYAELLAVIAVFAPTMSSMPLMGCTLFIFFRKSHDFST